jgi:hypothetical protein
MMVAAFAVKAQTEGTGQSPFMQLLLLGVIGAGAAIGGFVGNALGSRLHFGKPDEVIVGCVGATLLATVLATLLPGLATAAIVGLVGSTTSALAKINLDAVIQEDLPEESRASAFGRSETVLQMAWCFGGAVGLLLPPTYWLGFLVASILLLVGLAQTFLVRRGGSLIPGLGSDRPVRPAATNGGPIPSRGTPRGPAASRWRAGSESPHHASSWFSGTHRGRRFRAHRLLGTTRTRRDVLRRRAFCGRPAVDPLRCARAAVPAGQ